MSWNWGSCDNNACLDFNVFWTGDLRGRFLPAKRSVPCDPRTVSSACTGGHARRITYIQEQKRNLSKRHEGVVVADLGGSAFGGMFHGHPHYPYGYPATALQNLMPYDFCLFGASDFLVNADASEQSRKELADSHTNRTCPLLLANAHFNGSYDKLNRRISKYRAESTPDQKTVCFVGLFDHQANYAYTYGRGIVNLDPESLLSSVMDGSIDLRIDVATFVSNVAHTGDWLKLQPHDSDVYKLSTFINVDALTAEARCRHAHPNASASVLLITKGSPPRTDSHLWMAEYGPFDVIIISDPIQGFTDPFIVRSSALNRTRLVAASKTPNSMSRLKFRIGQTGVQKYAFEEEVPLGQDVPLNATAQSLLIQFYDIIRTKDSQPYGSISHSLVGGWNRHEAPPSMNQCYNTDCSIGDHVGRAMLWKAQSAGYRAHVSFYNLGGIRAALIGVNGTISLSHCNEVLAFQNTLELYQIFGNDLYRMMEGYLGSNNEIGFVGAGMRIAIHETCWGFVNHSVYVSGRFVKTGHPGTPAAITACRNSGIQPKVEIIDIEVEEIDFGNCTSNDYWSCNKREWRPLEKGSMYTIVSTAYIAGRVNGLVPLSISLGIDGRALCDYIAKFDPLPVEPWQDYRDRGTVQYSTLAIGFASGSRVPSVQSSVSAIQSRALCPAGKYVDPQVNSCVDCPAGRRSTTDIASDRCEKCPVRYFNNISGSGDCIPCAAGKYGNETGQIECAICLAGQYSKPASYACTDCPPGTVQMRVGSAVCDICPLGTYAHNGTCAHCGKGQVTLFWTASRGEWITGQGATNVGHCGCDLDMQNDDTGQCVPCGTGLKCIGMGHVQVLPGYASDGRLSVFHCDPYPKRCPGGRVGHCAKGRKNTSIACSDCEESLYPANNGMCDVCDGASFIVIVFGVVVMSTFLCLIYWSHNRKEPFSASTSFMMLGITMTQMVSMIQYVGIVGLITVEWPQSLADLFQLMNAFNIDIRLLRIECVAYLGPVAQFTTRICALLVTFAFVFVIHVVSALATCTFSKVPLLGSGGTLMMMFFISIVNVFATPFQCSAHPNGLSTVWSYPGVICWQGGEHTSMVIIGSIALVWPVSFLVLSLWVILLLPSRMSMGDTDFLRTWTFLVNRYRPGMYWWAPISLTRNAFVALAPLFETPLKQIVWLQLVVLSSILTTQQFRPWRVWLANFLDVFQMIIVWGIISMCSFLVDDADHRGLTMFVFTGLGIVILIVSCAIMFAVVGLVHSRLRKQYQFFLCHHKAAAGTSARLFKLMLARTPGVHRRIFLDSDDLSDLSRVFEIVGHHTQSVVVLLTSGVLRRPWCAGEIATAHHRDMPVVVVVFPGAELPSPEFINNYQGHVSDIRMMSHYGITLMKVQTALHYLVTKPSVHLGECLTIEIMHHACKQIVSLATLKSSASSGLGITHQSSAWDYIRTRSSTGSKTLQTKTGNSSRSIKPGIVIVHDPTNFESAAAALILRELLIVVLCHNPNRLPMILQAEDTDIEIGDLILMCTSGMFHQPHVMDAIFLAAELEATALPVISDVAFQIPATSKLSPCVDYFYSDDSPHPHVIRKLINDIFQEIAIAFQCSDSAATLLTLKVKAGEVAHRLCMLHRSRLRQSPIDDASLAGSLETSAGSMRSMRSSRSIPRGQLSVEEITKELSRTQSELQQARVRLAQWENGMLQLSTERSGNESQDSFKEAASVETIRAASVEATRESAFSCLPVGWSDKPEVPATSKEDQGEIHRMVVHEKDAVDQMKGVDSLQTASDLVIPSDPPAASIFGVVKSTKETKLQL